MNPTLEHFFSKIRNKGDQNKITEKQHQEKSKEVHKPNEANKSEAKPKKSNERDKNINQKSLRQYFKPNQNTIKLQQKQREVSPEINQNLSDEKRDGDLENNQYEYLYNKYQKTFRKEECKSTPKFERRRRTKKPFQTSILSFIQKSKIKQQEEPLQLDPVDIDWKKINSQLSQLHLIPVVNKKKIKALKKSVQKPQKQIKINQIKKEENYQVSKPIQGQISRLRKTRNKNIVNYREKSSPESVQRSSQPKKPIIRNVPRKIPEIEHKIHLVLNKKESKKEDRRSRSQLNNKIEKICIEYPKQGHSIHIDYQKMVKNHKQTLKLLFQSYI